MIALQNSFINKPIGRCSSAKKHDYDSVETLIISLYKLLSNHQCTTVGHSHDEMYKFIQRFCDVLGENNIYISNEDRLSYNKDCQKVYNFIDNLLKKNKTQQELISLLDSPKAQNDIFLRTLKEAKDIVNPPPVKLNTGLSAPLQNQGLNNSSQKLEERMGENKPLAENKLKKLLLPVTGAASIIGTLIFLIWNKLFDKQPTSLSSTNDLKDTNPPINLKQILQNLPQN